MAQIDLGVCAVDIQGRLETADEGAMLLGPRPAAAGTMYDSLGKEGRYDKRVVSLPPRNLRQSRVHGGIQANEATVRRKHVGESWTWAGRSGRLWKWSVVLAKWASQVIWWAGSRGSHPRLRSHEGFQECFTRWW